MSTPSQHPWWVKEKPAALPAAPRFRGVAYYRHSARDRQENSVSIQQELVQKWANENGVDIIQEFADRGKSGLTAEGRDGFNEMMNGWVKQRKDFDFVLCLDVSRWGRFQDIDLSATYSAECKKHGKQVIYTTLGMPRPDDPLYPVYVQFERFRAAQYSKELSTKVFHGCVRIAQQGYRANIVTYTVAIIARLTAQRIDLDRIWREQRLSPVLQDAIRDISVYIHRHITQPPDGGNVTEWCKKEACWESLRDSDIALPAAVEKELVNVGKEAGTGGDSGIDTLTGEEKKLIAAVSKIAPDVWFRISKWAKETDNLNSFQRSLAYNVGKMVAGGRKPSRKQAVQAWKALEEAGRLGCGLASD